MISPTPTYLTEKQVSKLFEISVFTLQKHRQKRIGFPWYKIGRSIRYRLDECLAFLQNAKAGA